MRNIKKKDISKKIAKMCLYGCHKCFYSNLNYKKPNVYDNRIQTMFFLFKRTILKVIEIEQ